MTERAVDSPDTGTRYTSEVMASLNLARVDEDL
jgi:hypothetical protein